MTNSVRYVFAHCSRPIPLVQPPRSGDIWWGAADLFAYNSAADRAKIQNSSAWFLPWLILFLIFSELRPFLTRRLSWLQLPTFKGACKRGGWDWGWVGCRRSSWKIHSKSKTKMPASYNEGGLSPWQRTYFQMGFIAPKMIRCWAPVNMAHCLFSKSLFTSFSNKIKRFDNFTLMVIWSYHEKLSIKIYFNCFIIGFKHINNLTKYFKLSWQQHLLILFLHFMSHRKKLKNNLVIKRFQLFLYLYLA